MRCWPLATPHRRQGRCVAGPRPHLTELPSWCVAGPRPHLTFEMPALRRVLRDHCRHGGSAASCAPCIARLGGGPSLPPSRPRRVGTSTTSSSTSPTSASTGASRGPASRKGARESAACSACGVCVCVFSRRMCKEKASGLETPTRSGAGGGVSSRVAGTRGECREVVPVRRATDVCV